MEVFPPSPLYGKGATLGSICHRRQANLHWLLPQTAHAFAHTFATLEESLAPRTARLSRTSHN